MSRPFQSMVLWVMDAADASSNFLTRLSPDEPGRPPVSSACSHWLVHAHASQTGTEKAHWVGNLSRITGGFLMPAWPVSTQAQGPGLLLEAAGASSAR